jgi:hypothetical protein
MMAHNYGWQQHVEQPEKWAVEHCWLLEEIYAAFERLGDWPEISAIERSLSKRDSMRAIEAAQLVHDMPSELGGRDVQTVALNARALRQLRRGAPTARCVRQHDPTRRRCLPLCRRR